MTRGSPATANPPQRILHLEDNLPDAELVRALIKAEWPNCEIKIVTNRFAYTGELQLAGYDLILSDFNLGGFDGMDALRIAKERAPDTPFIFLSGTIGEDRAIEAVKAGAQDYVLKDRMKRLITAIHRALRERDERRNRDIAERRVRDLAEMVNQAREAIIITDLEDVVISWNAGAERMLGWRSEEVLGKSFEQLFRPGTEDQIRAARLENTAKDEWASELHLHTKQGVALVVESRFSVVRDENGQPKARLSSHTDITDRKRLEEHFLRAQRIENIGLLAAGIAHDLNNVLAPMIMATPMLREWVRDPAGLEMIEMLEKSAERGSGLVRQILSFTRGASGEDEPQLVPMSDLIRDLVIVISSTFPKVIRLEDFVAPDAWPVRASPIQVHQVLLNLCVNARDAMPHGGLLRLRVENCQLSAAAAQSIEGARAGAFVVLHVEDNGTGIPPAVLARMWEPFFTTKESGKGTGLGLSTVRGILRNHHGFIETRSHAGLGTTFRAYLPVAQSIVAGAAGTKRSIRGNHELILVVDDEIDIRDMTAAMLTRHDYRVMVASDGVEAINIFNQYQREIRLVISDLHMPGIDGAELARLIQSINPAVKILLVSGSSQTPASPQSGNSRDPGFTSLPKPFKLTALVSQVDALLHQPQTSPLSVG